jgi:hypothetical protein
MSDDWYPRWVYHPNEQVTRRNMERYREMSERFMDMCLRLHPDYYQLSMREKRTIREEIEKLLGYSIYS